MARFLIRRIAFGVVVMWLVATIVFMMYFIAPHDVARTLAGKQASAETVEAIRHNLGLDRPIIAQYGSFLWNALHGNFGFSYANSQPVTSLIAQALPVTASLVAGGAVLWLVIGVSTGVLAGTRPQSLVDRTTTGLALFFYSMPTFLLGEVLLLVLFFRLHLMGIDWFPAAGYIPLTQDPLQWVRYLILPWLTIALVTAATYVRLTRGSMLDVMGEDYIRTARAKGLRESRVVYRHGLPAALTPILTQFGIDVGTLLGGAIVTENVFGLPGLGELAINSLTKQDLPTIIGLVLLASAFVVVANILVDVCYGLLDAKVRLS
ncbi:ABC transporter permease [Pseudonocardia sp.]|jgi:peptide/nickel transport system permease protein|uniref:ABC transporter permease n=1 Tax=Pseudonocardia sp. TaxID=60912 RepID=UPI0031FC4C0F